jgi:hypothetical protein
VVERVVGALGKTAAKAAPRSLAKMTPQDAEDMRRMILRGETARCPADGAILKLEDSTTIGMTGEAFHARCPICGESAELDPPK